MAFLSSSSASASVTRSRKKTRSPRASAYVDTIAFLSFVSGKLSTIEGSTEFAGAREAIPAPLRLRARALERESRRGHAACGQNEHRDTRFRRRQRRRSRLRSTRSEEHT